jgi:TonB family protein
MRRIEKVRWVVAFLAIAAAGAGAQQNPAAPASGTAQTAAPTPDQDGVYRVEGGVVSPRIVEAAQANPPANIHADHLLMVRMTAVIGADGTVKDVAAFSSRLEALEDAAIAAVKSSKFEAGTLNGKPVPVLVCVRVPFFRIPESIPSLWPCPSGGDMGFMAHAGVRPPRILYAPDPEYSEQARRKRIQGVVIVSTVVDEQGMPTDIRVEKSLGHGLDEKAVACVGQYRFSPATTRDGKPVAERITIEMNFRLY